jgi:hypothetical protein
LNPIRESFVADKITLVGQPTRGAFSAEDRPVNQDSRCVLNRSSAQLNVSVELRDPRAMACISHATLININTTSVAL